MDDHPEIPGGQGGDALPSRSELLLLRKAARQRWGVPDAAKADAIFDAWKTLRQSANERHRLIAAGTLLEFDKADQKDDHAERKDALEREKLDRQAGRSGSLDTPKAIKDFLDAPDDDRPEPGDEA